METNNTNVVLSYLDKKIDVISKAKSEGKLILAIFGRPACSMCRAFKGLLNRVEVKSHLSFYVLWDSNIDISKDYKKYSDALKYKEFALPFICWIDPNTDTTIYTLNGLPALSILSTTLSKFSQRAPSYVPEPVITIEPLQTIVKKEDAIAKAKVENKMILGVFGRPGCTECKGNRKMLESKEVKPLIEKSYIIWELDIDKSKEWEQYAKAANLTKFALPLMCWIDPNDPNKSILTRAGTPSTVNMKLWLTKYAKCGDACQVKL